MKKLISSVLALAVLTTACLPSVALAQRRGSPPRGPRGCPPPPPHVVYRGSHHHRSGWYVAGGLLTGLAIGSILQNACAEPPRREVVYTTTRYVEAPTVVQEVQYVQPRVVIPESTITIWVRNPNDSQTPVTLRRASGDRYIGPRGEYYDGLPGNEQLRELYGL
ncbi:MAG: hypothetical protein GX571_08070 [Lentisphaerae bacterium]|jgi:hypothetical protein|nr:hypothetical protein [Lentisphaerota bacterium]